MWSSWGFRRSVSDAQLPRTDPILGKSGASLFAHLIPDDERLTIGVPCQGKSVTETLDLVDTVLSADIPELDDAVAGHAAQFGVLDGVEGDLLYGRSVAFELCREADIGLLRIPCVVCQLVAALSDRGDESDSQTRRVLSAAPVAMRLPSGFQPIERML